VASYDGTATYLHRAVWRKHDDVLGYIVLHSFDFACYLGIPIPVPPDTALLQKTGSMMNWHSARQMTVFAMLTEEDEPPVPGITEYFERLRPLMRGAMFQRRARRWLRCVKSAFPERRPRDANVWLASG
jgi:hypothetical protein